MSNDDYIFKAIADPTRREILYLLTVTPNGLNLLEIAGQFQMTRQAVTKHLGILEKAGLVKISSKGREKSCQANLLPLKSMWNWLEFYRKYWRENLNDLNRNRDAGL